MEVLDSFLSLQPQWAGEKKAMNVTRQHLKLQPQSLEKNDLIRRLIIITGKIFKVVEKDVKG